eukprot:TRINITY_DN3027_c0_g1_i1.p1 TRINITY_DN3027_c0_g1~~TRINITY_DN3027_c0_g1_i1.p1  ORF type:complete len:340 (-),score=23.94 TRINITY_DN3027_c0_g1_i1:118-1137(-)
MVSIQKACTEIMKYEKQPHEGKKPAPLRGDINALTNFAKGPYYNSIKEKLESLQKSYMSKKDAIMLSVTAIDDYEVATPKQEMHDLKPLLGEAELKLKNKTEEFEAKVCKLLDENHELARMCNELKEVVEQKEKVVKALVLKKERKVEHMDIAPLLEVSFFSKKKEKTIVKFDSESQIYGTADSINKSMFIKQAPGCTESQFDFDSHQSGKYIAFDLSKVKGEVTEVRVQSNVTSNNFLISSILKTITAGAKLVDIFILKDGACAQQKLQNGIHIGDYMQPPMEETHLGTALNGTHSSNIDLKQLHQRQIFEPLKLLQYFFLSHSPRQFFYNIIKRIRF